ncbi:MAG TPA: DUF11 domain-containing protein, partial [Anaeromyxobacteraceae bacterium]|nr:DUF11 domain-containing protein [Anaeromyxobacteraceae bacterium]
MKRTPRGFYLLLLPFAAIGYVLGCGDQLPVGLKNLNTGTGKLDLSITKSVNKDSAQEGSQVTYTITVKNLGPIVADTVTAGDTLPTGLTYASHTASGGTSYSPSTGFWTIGTLAVDSSQTLSLTATVNAGTAGSLLVNRAGVLAYQTDTALSNNLATATVRSIGSSAASKLAFTTQPPASTSAGTSFGTAVTVQTAQGSTATGYSGNVTVTITSGTGRPNAHLSGTTTVSVAAGVATFS